MTTKEEILSKLNDTTPPALEYVAPYSQYDNLVKVFTQNLQNAGGKVYHHTDIDSIYPKLSCVIDTQNYEGDLELSTLEQTELLILYPKLAVAQNGAVWIEPSSYPKELITLTQHIAIILDSKDIVSNMQEAYERVDVSTLSTGIFLSGPSKTADIEQALVIGAHGAVSLSVFIS